MGGKQNMLIASYRFVYFINFWNEFMMFGMDTFSRQTYTLHVIPIRSKQIKLWRNRRAYGKILLNLHTHADTSVYWTVDTLKRKQIKNAAKRYHLSFKLLDELDDSMHGEWRRYGTGWWETICIYLLRNTWKALETQSQRTFIKKLLGFRFLDIFEIGLYAQFKISCFFCQIWSNERTKKYTHIQKIFYRFLMFLWCSRKLYVTNHGQWLNRKLQAQ